MALLARGRTFQTTGLILRPSPRFILPNVAVIHSKTFLDSLFSSALGDCPLRSLTHTKSIPYSSSAVFKAISDVAGYPTFLPFAISSNVTSRDQAGYPTKAKLRIGYEKLGLEEDWDSVVRCDPSKGVIEAMSSEQNSQSLFHTLKTKWQIGASDNTNKAQTKVKLDVDVRFKNPIYDQMFAQVEERVAATMISAFEKRVQELEDRK